MRMLVIPLVASLLLVSSVEQASACARRLGCTVPTPRAPEPPAAVPARPVSNAGAVTNSTVTPKALRPSGTTQVDPNKVRQNARRNALQANVTQQSNRVEKLIPSPTSPVAIIPPSGSAGTKFGATMANPNVAAGVAANGQQAKRLLGEAVRVGDHVSAAKLGAAVRRSDEIVASAQAAQRVARSSDITPHVRASMANRGWSEKSVLDTVNKPSHVSPTTMRNGEAGTASFRVDHHYVVRNNKTGNIWAVSDTTKPMSLKKKPGHFVIDGQIQNPPPGLR
ncbi:colicin E5-related ribonuclease [Pseudooceanicola atlanticus]|uniref:colicin E5-related ribonuclease n=1 Tax=Pseudooceanicola atlanticus TaxID=1461694 RepID=UPI003B59B521